MLATRRGETELSHPWSFNKLEPSYPRKSSPSPRMSNTGFETPLSNSTEWTGQYSFLPPAEPIFAAQAYDHVNGSAETSSISSGANNNGTSSANNASSGANMATNGTSSNGQPQGQSRPTTGTNGESNLDHLGVKEASSPLGLHHRRSIDPLGLRQSHSQHGQSQQQSQQTTHLGKPSTPTASASDHHADAHSNDVYGQKVGDSVVGHDESSLVAPSDTSGLSLGHNSLVSNPLSSVLQIPEITTSHIGGSGSNSNGAVGTGGGEDHSGLKDDDDELIDDEEMGEGGDVEGVPPPAQTPAERTAQRRKMKRFRLTHQQTRFLMSEFAKQPHPDAAHRERLSREIPGLSPRQVQVWFQNRRAKIKRLAADDRERVIKMRAVPDDFDNVQALHSPYGAVHGLGTPMASPVDFGASSYADHMMRPLMVDVRRPDGDDHLSPTGLSPAFGSIGFNASATMSNPDILSPLSPTSTNDHRYGSYSSHLSAGGSSTSGAAAVSPLSAGSRTSNPYARSSLDNTGLSMASTGSSSHHSPHHHHQRHQIRPLQPLQLRETMSRSRSDNLQSPLRSSMSWKGDSLDYTNYPGGNASPQLSGRPQQSLYQSDGLGGGSSTTTTLGGYDSSTYSGSTVQSPTHMAYPGFQSAGLQASNQSRTSRLRAASATLPLALDLRTTSGGAGSAATNPQFRSIGSAMSSAMHSPTSRPATTLGTLGGLGGVSSTSSYTAFPTSAPLTAPLDYNLSRTSGYRTSAAGGTSGTVSNGSTDYSIPQMSAPLAPPNDFTQAFQASMGAVTSAPSTTSIAAALNSGSVRTPNSYSSLGHHHHSSMSNSLDRSNSSGGMGNDFSSSADADSGTSGSGINSLKRKHSFTLGGGSGSSGMASSSPSTITSTAHAGGVYGNSV